MAINFEIGEIRVKNPNFNEAVVQEVLGILMPFNR